ncbi:MAG: DUF2298 domain-containing protein [Methylococcaceae bacterium]
MYLIYLLLTIGLIAVNLAGLTALVSRYLPAQASARLLGLFVFTLSMFAVEHWHGLGKLSGFWVLSTGLAVWSILQRQQGLRLRQFWMGELVFIVGFIYGIAWRFAYPNIDAGSEHITDLYFISNFMGGATLPAPDRWLAGAVFDCYYAFQHYAAALLARLFSMDIGLAMNLAWALSIALMVSLAWEISGYFVKRYSFRALLLAALMLGGNGLSPLMPLMITDNATDDASLQNKAVNRIWASTRFAGSYDQQVNTVFGQAVAGDPRQADFAAHLELPLETIAYYSVLGDYHPPLGGFVIALWTLALSAFLGMRKVVHSEPLSADSSHADALAFFALGLTPALILVTNAWVLPLQWLLLASWLLLRYWKADIHWHGLISGGVMGLVLIYPFLSYFAANAPMTSLHWVLPGSHSPWAFFVAMQWPLLLWLGVGLVLARRSPWAAWLTLTLLIIFCFSEWVYVDDPLEGKYQRFNTTLKWWSWLWPTALIGLGSVALGLGGRLIKTVMVLSLSALLLYSVDIARYWRYVGKPQLGQLAGNGWLTQDATLRTMLAHLKNAPDGIVLESIEQGAYSASGALTLFANKPLLLGWPDHIAQWRGNAAYISNRAADIRAFYKGELFDPLGFLGKFSVQTIVWSLADQQRMPLLREVLQNQISRDYQWRAFDSNGAQAVGLWERRVQTAAMQH